MVTEGKTQVTRENWTRDKNGTRVSAMNVLARYNVLTRVCQRGECVYWRKSVFTKIVCVLITKIVCVVCCYLSAS